MTPEDQLRELEAALATAFTVDNLQVYGDYLMSLGDPRGELVAVDVHEARLGTSPEVRHRRRRALRAWLDLAPEIDPTQGAWDTVRFAYGFVDDVRVELASRILSTAAGPFVRGLTLTKKVAGIENALLSLAREPRPWLSRLTIAPRFRGEPPGRPWRGEAPNLANTALPDVIAATPRLERLELAGHRLVRDFPHPHLRSLRIAGIDAFLPVLEPRAPLPAANDLALEFAHAPGEPVLLQRPWPALLPAASFPALERLDLSGNEAQRSTTDTQIGVFEVLPTLGVLEQLVELRLPSIRNGHEAAIVQRALDRMPALRRVEVMRGWGKHVVRHASAEVVEIAVPWPRFESAQAEIELWIELPGETKPLYVRSYGGLLLTQRFEDLDEPGRAAWVTLWETIASLIDAESAARSVPVAILSRALEAVGYIEANQSRLHPWWALREHVRAVPQEGDAWIARRRQQLTDRD